VEDLEHVLLRGWACGERCPPYKSTNLKIYSNITKIVDAATNVMISPFILKFIMPHPILSPEEIPSLDQTAAQNVPNSKSPNPLIPDPEFQEQFHQSLLDSGYDTREKILQLVEMLNKRWLLNETVALVGWALPTFQGGWEKNDLPYPSPFSNQTTPGMKVVNFEHVFLWGWACGGRCPPYRSTQCYN
jgi:hypothetical protein